MSEHERISSEGGYCPSLAELIEVPTANAEKWINSRTTTKAELSSLLKLAIQQIKNHESLSRQINELRTELRSTDRPTAPDLTSMMHDELANFREHFRSEIISSVQEEVKKALHTSTSDNTRPTYCSIAKPAHEKEIHHVIRDVRAERQAQQLLVKDDEEREKRKLNVRVRGLPQKTDVEDKVLFEKMLNDLGIEAEIENTRRVGVKPHEVQYRYSISHSILVVTLKDARKRSALLRASRNLATVASKSYSNVFVEPDYTSIEDKELFDMRQEKRRRNADIEDSAQKWVIYRGSLKQVHELPSK